MRFSAVTCCLASVVATLVVVTTSLPESPSGRPDDISWGTRHPLDRTHHRPIRCLRIGAKNQQQDVELKPVKRDSHSPGTHAVALDPRKSIEPPCGRCLGGDQTITFGFATNRPLKLVWNFDGNWIGLWWVYLMQVNPHGRDILVRLIAGAELRVDNFVPVNDVRYYVRVTGQFARAMTWHFAFQYASSCHALFYFRHVG